MMEEQEKTNGNPTTVTIPENAIGEAAAKAAALAHAGVTEQQVKYVTCDPQIGHGPDHYDVKFVTGGMKYKYAVDLYDGSIQGRAVKNKAEKGSYVYEGDYHEHHATVPPQATATASGAAEPQQAAPTAPQAASRASAPAAAPQGTPETPQDTTSAPSSGTIDEQQALAIALQQAGLTQNDLIRYRVKLRDKHGSLLYRFKLKIEGYECEVDVNARTGAVTKFHREIDTRS